MNRRMVAIGWIAGLGSLTVLISFALNAYSRQLAAPILQHLWLLGLVELLFFFCLGVSLRLKP